MRARASQAVTNGSAYLAICNVPVYSVLADPKTGDLLDKTSFPFILRLLYLSYFEPSVHTIRVVVPQVSCSLPTKVPGAKRVIRVGLFFRCSILPLTPKTLSQGLVGLNYCLGTCIGTMGQDLSCFAAPRCAHRSLKNRQRERVATLQTVLSFLK